MTVVVMGLVVMVPKNLTVATTPLPLWVQALGGILGGIADGFYFRMLLECILKRGISRRVLWIVFFLVMPIFSAIIYFMTTRSTLYQSVGSSA